MPVDMVLLRELVANPAMPVAVIGEVLASLTIPEREEVRQALTPAEQASPEWTELQTRMEQQDVAQLWQDVAQIGEIAAALDGNADVPLDELIAMGGQIHLEMDEHAAGPHHAPGDGPGPAPGAGPEAGLDPAPDPAADQEPDPAPEGQEGPPAPAGAEGRGEVAD